MHILHTTILYASPQDLLTTALLLILPMFCCLIDLKYLSLRVIALDFNESTPNNIRLGLNDICTQHNYV